MSVWDAYPAEYRQNEVNRILAAVRAGESALVIGLSGAGKSNLMGFLYHRQNNGSPAFVLVDGNRAQPKTAEGLFRLTGQALGAEISGLSDLSGLERAVSEQLSALPNGLCLLFDRYDALSTEERSLASGPLRALRDAFKYQLTYVIAARRPLDPGDELAELFYANTLWLGPLSPADARWSAAQYAKRRGQVWDEATLEALVRFSWGYPSLLRACAEAAATLAAEGTRLDLAALREHPAIQRRLQEFWADQPTPDDLRRSGLKDHPLLSAAQPVLSAESPELTALEHRLLAWFQAHEGEVCAKDELIHAVWPDDRVVDGLRDDSLAQLIRRLRTKIEPDPTKPHHIITIPGRGYRYIKHTARNLT